MAASPALLGILLGAVDEPPPADDDHVSVTDEPALFDLRLGLVQVGPTPREDSTYTLNSGEHTRVADAPSDGQPVRPRRGPNQLGSLCSVA